MRMAAMNVNLLWCAEGLVDRVIAKGRGHARQPDRSVSRAHNDSVIVANLKISSEEDCIQGMWLKSVLSENCDIQLECLC